jgi:phosphatidylglycerol:prolipoprotein diacylglycerol transferase
LIGAYLWQRGASRKLPIGQLTGEYLVLSGIARFLVEFIRINPRIHWGMSNAQVASLGSIAAGILLILWARRSSVNMAEQLAAKIPAEARQ